MDHLERLRVTAERVLAGDESRAAASEVERALLDSGLEGPDVDQLLYVLSIFVPGGGAEYASATELRDAIRHWLDSDLGRSAGRVVEEPQRERVLSSLGATGCRSDEACKAALESGAGLYLSGGPVPVSSLVTIYRARLKRLRARGIRFVGDDVVERLQECGQSVVRIALVHGRDNYTLFLEPSQDVVLASIGVDGAVANPDFEWP